MILGLLALAATATRAAPTGGQAPAPLVEAEARYAELTATGGWPVLPEGAALEPEGSDARIPILRRRLAREGYRVDRGQGPVEYYDERLAAAVRRFQELHGLLADGVVGRATRRELNVPAPVRLSQLRANLSRVETLPPGAGAPALVVNIPAFTLDVIDSGRVLFTLRVIVGRATGRPPLYRPLRPSWSLPRLGGSRIRSP